MAAAEEPTGFEHLGFDPAAYEALEVDFDNVLGELGADAQLERFRLEYETLYRALKKSHESEKRLLKKCRELTTEITSTGNKVATAAKLSLEDQNVIAQLKKDIEKTWGAVEQSHEKEAQTKEQLASLRGDIDALRTSVEQGAGSSIQQENKLRDLTMSREELARDRDSHAQQVMQVRAEATELQERLKTLETEKALAETAVIELTTGISNKRAEVEKERRRKDGEEKKLKELKATADKRQTDIRAKQTRVNTGARRLPCGRGGGARGRTGWRRVRADPPLYTSILHPGGDPAHHPCCRRRTTVRWPFW